MYPVSRFVDQFAKALLGGATLATLWVNLAPASYYDSIEYRLFDLALPGWTGIAAFTVTPMSLVSDVLMSLFLVFIGKEFWEAIVLERGALSARSKVALPLGAILGGMIGAAALWMTVQAMLAQPEGAEGFYAGWTVPLGSDVILCYVMGRVVFGRNHPALHQLLLITIAFDILGLLLNGLANPEATIRPAWLIMPALALAGIWLTITRYAKPGATERQHQRAQRLWPYLVAGVLCWVGMALAGLPPTLGLLPMLAVVPHAERSFGLFAEAEEFLHDPLNQLAHLIVRPLPWILFLFGLTYGGVDVLAFGPTTGTVLAALWVGKPLGIFIGALAAIALTSRTLPPDLRLSNLVLIALIAGTGFTTPLLATASALPGGEVAEAARAGLALSIAAGPLVMLLARAFHFKRQN